MMTPATCLRVSVAAALATIVLKLLAWWFTESVGYLSDALESFVNLAGATFALWMVSLSRLPADDDHPYGHGKAEYFSAGFEGVLIVGAAVGILWAAIERLLMPVDLGNPGVGALFSLISTLINFAVSRLLMTAARQHRSLALEADARHLMTDVWTSVGVVVGVSLAIWSGMGWLDPAVAALVALNILREAWGLIRRACDGLMDRALEGEELQALEAVLAEFAGECRFADLRTRQGGALCHATVKLLLPGDASVAEAHALADRVEQRVFERVHIVLTTHVEPLSGRE